MIRFTVPWLPWEDGCPTDAQTALPATPPVHRMGSLAGLTLICCGQIPKHRRPAYALSGKGGCRARMGVAGGGCRASPPCTRRWMRKDGKGEGGTEEEEKRKEEEDALRR